MKYIYKKISFIILLIISFNVNAQWTKLFSPPGAYGGISLIQQVGDEIWASTDDGIYISKNNGLFWEKGILENKRCLKIIQKKDSISILYAQINGYKDFYYRYYSMTSYDGGNSWEIPILLDSSDSFRYDNYEYYACGSTIVFKNWINNTYISNDYGKDWKKLKIDTTTEYEDIVDVIYSGGYL